MIRIAMTHDSINIHIKCDWGISSQLVVILGSAKLFMNFDAFMLIFWHVTKEDVKFQVVVSLLNLWYIWFEFVAAIFSTLTFIS